MANIKHIGKVKGSSERVMIVFRQMMDENGNVVDPDKCLAVKLDTLPDMLRQSIDGIVHSLNAQESLNLYEYLSQVKVGDGRNALGALHADGRIIAINVDDVLMTVNSKTQIELRDLNNALSSMDVSKPAQVTADMPTSTNSEEVVEVVTAVDPEIQARALLDEANELMVRVKYLRHEAKELDPSLDLRNKM